VLMAAEVCVYVGARKVQEKAGASGCLIHHAHRELRGKPKYGENLSFTFTKILAY